MEKKGASTDSAKRMMELEAEISWLKEDNRRLVARNAVPEKPNLDDSKEKDEAIVKLRGEVMAMKRTKEMWKEKYVKARDESEEKDELIVKLEEELKAIAETEEMLKHKYVKIRDQLEEKEELIVKLEEEVNGITEMKAKLKEKLESGEMKWSEGREMNEEKCRRLEFEKRKLEVDLKEMQAFRVREEAANTKIADLKTSVEYRDGTVMRLVEKIERLDREKMKIEEELRDKVLKLEAANKFMKNGDPQSSDEARKKRLEEDETTKVQEFLQRIEVLEKEISREEEKVSNGKMSMEAKEKKISELHQRIEVLEKKNREMKAKVCHGNGEKSEVVKREEGENNVLKLVTDRMGILVPEKRGLEEEIKQKGEAIKVLKQENDRLNDIVKNLKMEIDRFVAKLEGDVESSQQDIANNVGILGNPIQIEGQKSAGFPHSEEHERSLNHGVTENIHVKKEGEMSNANACKRKWPLPQNLTGGKSCVDAVALSSYGNSSIAKRLRSSIKRSYACN